MRIYFLSERPSALFVNGLYLGVADTFARSAELTVSDGLHIQFSPVDALPLSFLLNEETLFSPPEGLETYHVENGIVLYAREFAKSNHALTVLWQERISDTLLTLCLQGKLQLNVENEHGFHLLPLPDCLEKSTVREWAGHFLIESDTAFLLLSREGKKVLFSEGKILSAEKTLKAEVPFHDSMGHSAVCEWEGDRLVSCAIRSRLEPMESTFALALFECALIGADVTPFLHESLLAKAHSLKEFLGGYVSVWLTDEPDRVGLVYQERERVFQVRYFRVTVTDGKISNISPD